MLYYNICNNNNCDKKICHKCWKLGVGRKYFISHCFQKVLFQIIQQKIVRLLTHFQETYEK